MDITAAALAILAPMPRAEVAERMSPSMVSNPTVPAAGTRLSVRVDEGTSDDLAAIMNARQRQRVHQPLAPQQGAPADT